MPTGSSSYRYQEQLEADLGTGRAIPYRRLPGTGQRKFGPRTYYDPATGNQVSEDYVVRHYRPALRSSEQAQYADLRQRQANFNAQQARIRASLQQTFLIKKASEAGLPINGTTHFDGSVTYSFPRSFISANSAEFTRLYGELRYYQVTSRHSLITGYNPQTGAPIVDRTMLAPDGDYANTLVELGRRKPDEDFEVGMSPDSRGGYTLNDYIVTTVIPYYSGS